MIQGSDVSLLNNWQNFFMIMGTAAATLTGLMFVSTTLLAGLDTHTPIANAGISAYNTPTVVQFGAVLLLSGILSAPWQTFSMISLLLGVLGLGMVVYSIIVLRRMRRVPFYQTTLEDWCWYLILPLLANISLMVAALLLANHPSPALYIIGFALLLLLTVGIRNAWDNVTFLALKRTHTHSDEESQEQKHGNPTHHEHGTPK